MLRALGGAGVRVLVVDDNSPDGPGAADRLAQELDYHVPTVSQGGARPAYIAASGRRWPTAPSHPGMDCDFSHDPKDVPRLIPPPTTPTWPSAPATSRRAGCGLGPARRRAPRAFFLCARAALVADRDLTAAQVLPPQGAQKIDLERSIRRATRSRSRRPTALRAGFRVVEVPIRSPTAGRWLPR